MDKKFDGNPLGPSTKSNNFLVTTSDLAFALSACFTTTFDEFFLYVNSIKSDLEFLFTNDKNSLLPCFVLVLGKHMIKNLSKITKLSMKTHGTVITFAQGLSSISIL